jgi:hypothetical protein
MPKQSYISASMAKDVMTNGRGKDNPFGATFVTRAKAIGASRVGYDVSTDLSGNFDIERGLEFEWEAIETYKEVKLAQVHGEQKWIQREDIRAGCTPDGLVGDVGMIEVKCPRPHNHLANLLDNEQLAQYLPQMQFSLWVTGRQWCDFISYDSTAPDGLKLHVHRVERDEAYIDSLAMRTAEMDALADEYAERLRSILTT